MVTTRYHLFEYTVTAYTNSLIIKAINVTAVDTVLINLSYQTLFLANNFQISLIPHLYTCNMSIKYLTVIVVRVLVWGRLCENQIVCVELQALKVFVNHLNDFPGALLLSNYKTRHWLMGNSLKSLTSDKAYMCHLTGSLLLYVIPWQLFSPKTSDADLPSIGPSRTNAGKIVIGTLNVSLQNGHRYLPLGENKVTEFNAKVPNIALSNATL